MEESRYNKWYGQIAEEEIPGYLRRGWAEERWRRMIGFRLGNEMLEGWCRIMEKGRRCRICGNEEETWEHILQ